MTEVAHARSLIESIADPIGLHIKSSALKSDRLLGNFFFAPTYVGSHGYHR
ncbi:MAG: hypothetical protein ACREYE_04330 [Gammaproteobacteria bacterium]